MIINTVLNRLLWPVSAFCPVPCMARKRRMMTRNSTSRSWWNSSTPPRKRDSTSTKLTSTMYVHRCELSCDSVIISCFNSVDFYTIELVWCWAYLISNRSEQSWRPKDWTLPNWSFKTQNWKRTWRKLSNCAWKLNWKSKSWKNSKPAIRLTRYIFLPKIM